jgi:hypothetical protein
MARTVSFVLLVVFGSCLVDNPLPVGLDKGGDSVLAGASQARTERTAFLGCNLSDEDVITVTTNLAASGRAGEILLDSAEADSRLRDFLTRFRPHRVVPVGTLLEAKKELDERLGVSTEPALQWNGGPPLPLWRALFSSAPRVVVCPLEPRRTLLLAACLAGVSKAPLYVLRGQPGEASKLRQQLSTWGATEVLAVGKAVRICQNLKDIRVVSLASEQQVNDLTVQTLLGDGPIQTLVVANPADTKEGRCGMSALAPWIAVQKRAPLLLTNEAGADTRALVERSLKRAALRRVDALILVADLKAIPPERRLNPIPGKDAYIEMEPLTPTGSEPFSLATGRFFQKDTGLLALMLARQHLLTAKNKSLKALVVSNPAGGLPLLETFSRNTAKELQNRGYDTATLFGDRVSKEAVRRLLPQQDIFLWEGHHSTMVRDYGLPDWPEQLEPSLVFLQSCLALCEPEALPLMERGAIGVIGTSTRTYSASGGACSLAFFNALLYENQTLGSSLRQAKNFLLAYALLKEKRIGDQAKLSGANLRSAWAFTLWGDPTLQMPAPELPPDALPVVHHEVRGNSIVLFQPEEAYDRVAVRQYRSHMLPNARMAGLLQKDATSPERRLAPLLFAEVSLPKAPNGKVPQLHSRLPSDRYVFCWDPRRRSGYLLAAPRAKDTGDLHFQVRWEASETIAATKSVVHSP